MTTIGSGHSTIPAAGKIVKDAQPTVQFSGKGGGAGDWFDKVRTSLTAQSEEAAERVAEAAEKSESNFVKNLFGKSKEVTGSFVGRVLSGLKRTLTKSLLRPRGWLEMALIPVGGVGLVFPVKHFIEGFTNTKSIFIKRKFSLMHGNPVTGNPALLRK